MLLSGVPLLLVQVPLRMKLLVEPWGPQGMPVLGTTVAAPVLEPWQSLQYMVCVPTSAVPFQGARQGEELVMPRCESVRPVLSITGCQLRWLLVR